MHLTELIRARAVPAAGVYLSLTRRCPLSCAHCSTRSTLSSDEADESPYRRFVDTFTEQDHPRFMVLTGGEALLRPRLVRDLAVRARAVGTSVVLASGLYFVRNGRVPAAIADPLQHIDHLTVGLDEYHDREVPRGLAFDFLEQVVAGGLDVSIQTCASGPDDPYVDELVAEARRRFDDRVPILVSTLGAVGRAADWMPAGTVTIESRQAEAHGCAVASWPVVAFDGAVVACCNQRVVDGTRPDHLRLGHAATATWTQVREQVQGSRTLRAVRVWGPRYLAVHVAGRSCTGVCDTCIGLPSIELDERLGELVGRDTFRFVEAVVTGSAGPAALDGLSPDHLGLLELGAPGTSCAP